MTPRFSRHGVTLLQGDALAVLPTLETDRAKTVIITDPVWPNAPAGMFPVDDALALFTDAALHFPRLARRVVVILGCNSDPRFLMAVPSSLPFVRACWLRYEIPSARGTVLNSGDVAYVFGDHRAPEGYTLLAGEASSPGSLGRGGSGPRGAHPCPRDIGHMRWLVERLTWSGDTVLDPFAGAGTTLIAAREHGRTAIGIEINERYCDHIEHRLNQEPLGLVLPPPHDATNGAVEGPDTFASRSKAAA